MSGDVEGRRQGKNWLSAHIHFSGDLYGAAADDLLSGIVEPIVRKSSETLPLDAWFFLRYNQPTEHLRVRLRLPEDLCSASTQALIEENFRKLQGAAGGPGLLEFRWAVYEPELDRYGGPQGVALAEELFYRSSEMALSLLRKVQAGDRPARLGKAMLAMLVLVYGYAPQRAAAAEFSRAYGHGYLRTLVPDPKIQEQWLKTFEASFQQQASGLSQYLEVAWEALIEGDSLTEELDLYRSQMEDHRKLLQKAWEAKGLQSDGELYPSWNNCISRIVPSYLHMMNNRLGVNLQEESYLSVLIDWTLRQAESVT